MLGLCWSMMGVGPVSCWGKWGSMQVGENEPATDFFSYNKFLLNHFGGYVVPMLDQCWAIHLRAPQNRSGGCSWAYVGPFGGYDGPCWAMLKLRWGGLADGGGDFCRARTLSPSSPTKCPDRGVVLGPMLGHLEAMVGHVGLCWAGLADGGGDFCRARTLSPSCPTKCPDLARALTQPVVGKGTH